MNCDDVRTTLIDALAMRHLEIDADLRAHLDSCPACRAARDEYSAIWRQLGEVAVPEAPHDARARFDRRPIEERRPSTFGTGRRTPWYLGAWAATLLIAALAGHGLTSSQPNWIARMAQVETESTFLILLHEDSTFRFGRTPAASNAMRAEYIRWANAVPSGVTLLGDEKLEDSALWAGAPRNAEPDGDHIGGFVMVQSKDSTAVRQMIAISPHLKYGGRIELRMISP